MPRKTLTPAEQFTRDMERAGFEVEDFPTRRGDYLPAVHCTMGSSRYSDHPDVQDVVRATKVRLQWDGNGGLVVVMPVEG